MTPTGTEAEALRDLVASNLVTARERTELLTGCVRLGIPIVEMPVLVRYDNRFSTTNWKTSLRMLRGLWRIRKHWKTIPPLSDGPPEKEWRAAA